MPLDYQSDHSGRGLSPSRVQHSLQGQAGSMAGMDFSVLRPNITETTSWLCGPSGHSTAIGQTNIGQTNSISGGVDRIRLQIALAAAAGFNPIHMLPNNQTLTRTVTAHQTENQTDHLTDHQTTPILTPLATSLATPLAPHLVPLHPDTITLRQHNLGSQITGTSINATVTNSSVRTSVANICSRIIM